MKLYTWIIAILLSISLGAAMAYWMKKKPSRAEKILPIVTVARVKEKMMFNTVSTIGTLKAKQAIQVSAPVAGIVKNIYFRSGQWVKQGNYLMELKNDELNAQVKEDRAKYMFLEMQLNRYQKTYQKGAVAKADLDQLKSEAQQSLNAMMRDRALLNQTRIRSPFSGQIGLRKISKGQYLSAGASIASLVDTSVLYVDFSVTQELGPFILVGNEVQIEDIGKNQPILKAKIMAHENRLSLDRQLLVRAKLIPPFFNLFPGNFVRVIIPFQQKKKSLFIPENAVNYDAQGAFVYLEKNEQIFRKSIELGRHGNSNIEIRSGLMPQDRVVTQGQEKIYEGARVHVRQ